MVDTVDGGEEEHSGVNPISSTGDGGTLISREEFNVALDVGKRSINSKFSYVSPRSIYGETSNEGKESASTYPCRSLSGSVQVNGVDGVVLVVIQITGDPSAERTTPRVQHTYSPVMSPMP